MRKIPQDKKEIPNKSQIQIFDDPNGLEFDFLKIGFCLYFDIWGLAF